MFENIIGQQSTIAALSEDLASGTLPRALLLHGPPYSGKLSTALEIARVLTCAQDGRWSCSCPSCRRQRLLTHPGTLLAGSRYFEQEIAASADVLARTRKPPAQYLFIRAVRKLTRRFDPLLWEGEESRLRSLEGTLSQVEEALDALAPKPPEESGPAEKGLEKRLEAVKEGCRLLARALPADNIPVSVVRRASSWLHLTPGMGESRKILILETAERMLPASANALLKLLEEPPQEAWLILITARREALIPTVASRLRPYPFAERGPEASAEVLERIFRERRGLYSSLRGYFLRWDQIDAEALRNLAARFVRSLLAPCEAGEAAGGLGVLAEAIEALEAKADREARRKTARVFFEELSYSLKRSLEEGAVDVLRLGRWNEIFHRHQEAFEVYNQQPAMTVESLYYRMRGTQ